MPHIPLIEELTTSPIPAGSTLLVEFAGASQWYNASLTITAGWIKSGGKVSYNTFAQPPDKIRERLNTLGIEVDKEEKDDELRIWDYYSATLGQTSIEKHAKNSLKIADLSIEFSRQVMREAPQPEWLRIVDNEPTTLCRFNDEKSVVEFLLTRHFPSHGLRKSTAVFGLLKGVHSSWLYEQLEAASEGIIDFKVEEVSGERKNYIGIRTMRDVTFNGYWHPLSVGQNFEVTLGK